MSQANLDQTEAPSLIIQNIRQDFITLDGTELNVLDNINLGFREREFISFIGHSGCGKSTLLRIIAGLQTPTQGSILYKGKKIKGTSAARGMVFQQDAVFPWLTVRKNIEFGLKLKKLPRDKVRAQAEKWIALVGLGGWEDAYPKELSGGMRKRVDLARVYANTPDLMLMDEPFGALDQQTKSNMQTQLLRLWETAGSTVIFVTHDLEEAVFLSDRIVVLAPRPGRVKTIMDVSLSRPRREELRLSEEFLAEKRKLHELLKEDA
ncbi:ABC transporter ATP-binding protein [Devosia rhodophyticola]|uniref:ABC transporter ATP-binding protein n=1 Tax=Devosia rhodophyticola TaxID=3026423 RepID=A0ABY7YY20_9HYPH|nr:ABC transporter ATP-binding protein [Devosia rhodophyticola]WDR06139.1 ABC transporter ATP-binding protein [Devosia rhodophyticola]